MFLISAGLLFHFGVFRRAVDGYEGYGMREYEKCPKSVDKHHITQHLWF